MFIRRGPVGDGKGWRQAVQVTHPWREHTWASAEPWGAPSPHTPLVPTAARTHPPPPPRAPCPAAAAPHSLLAALSSWAPAL